MSALEATRPGATTATRRRRIVEGFGFVGVWTALGYLIGGDADVYLLVGLPLTAGFQVLVRRRPLRELWVRDGTTTTVDRRAVVRAVLLLLAPVYWGVRAAGDGDPRTIGWYLAAAAGVLAATYALRATSVRAVLRTANLPIAVGVLGNLLFVGGVQLVSGQTVDPAFRSRFSWCP